jgi:hypothetical protein
LRRTTNDNIEHLQCHLKDLPARLFDVRVDRLTEIVAVVDFVDEQLIQIDVNRQVNEFVVAQRLFVGRHSPEINAQDATLFVTPVGVSRLIERVVELPANTPQKSAKCRIGRERQVNCSRAAMRRLYLHVDRINDGRLTTVSPADGRSPVSVEQAQRTTGLGVKSSDASEQQNEAHGPSPSPIDHRNEQSRLTRRVDAHRRGM